MEMSAAFDKIKEQEWYQQIQNTYQQLPSEQQNYVRWGLSGLSVLLAGYLTFAVIQSANSSKNDYFEKQELSRVINEANDEIRRLRGQSSGLPSGSEQNWKSILSGMASSQGIPADSIEVAKEAPGALDGMIQESLLEVKMKNIPLRSLTQVVFQMEHGSPPMKLKGMIVEAGNDGLLNVKLNLSGYLAKPEKGEKSK
jgi:hypothetical protein